MVAPALFLLAEGISPEAMKQLQANAMSEEEKRIYADFIKKLRSGHGENALLGLGLPTCWI